MLVALRFAAALAVGSATGLAACGEDDAARCVNELCDPASFGQVCVGHAVQRCAADGLSFAYSACGAQERCDDSDGSAACVARACTTLGEATCVSVTEVERCRDDGSGTDRIPCGGGEVCKDGACVPGECAGQPDRCTTHGVLSCRDNAWVQDNCAVGSFCSAVDGGVARCNPGACSPESRGCDGASVRVCDARGAVATVSACPKDEVCVAGVCQAAVCGVGPADTSGEVSEVGEVGDSAGESDAEPESRVLFTLNGVVNTLNISAFASFDSGDRRVTVQAEKGSKKLELQLSPASQTVSGSFSSEVFNPVKVVVCYDDGGSAAGFEQCPEATHRSVAYDVEVTRNDGVDGRFEATFSATLEDVNSDSIELTAGQINVRYR